jgi:hypothetical protein
MTFRILKAYFSCVRSVTSLMLVIDYAVCEAAVRPTMRFVSVTSEDVQAVVRLSRDEKLLIRQRTQVINAHRVHPKELGEVVPKGERIRRARLFEMSNGHWATARRTFVFFYRLWKKPRMAGLEPKSLPKETPPPIPCKFIRRS